MIKWLEIQYLKYRVYSLTREMHDFSSFMILKGHYLHKERFDYYELVEDFKQKNRIKIIKLLRRIVKLKN